MIFVYFILLAIFAILTWKNLETGILLICALLPSYLIRFSIAGIPTTFLEMMVLIVVVVWIIRELPLLSKEGAGGRSRNPLALPIGLLLVAATIGIFISPDKHAAFGVWKAFYVEPVLMFFIVKDLLARSFDSVSSNSTPLKMTQENIFLALGISALLVSLFGLAQYFFSIGIPAPWDLERRITSIFEYPNALALFLEPIIVISWFMIASPPSFRRRGLGGGVADRYMQIFWITVSVLATINVFLAQSEAGIAALIVTAICIFLYSKITRKKTIASFLIIAALVFAIPTSRNYLVQKFTFGDFSEQVRLSQWKETITLLKDHPIFGAGLSGYPILMKQYHHDLPFEIFQYPHNIVLNIWVELGLVGLVAVAWLAILLVRSIRMREREGLAPPLRTILFCAIFFEIIIHGLVDVPYFKNDLAMMVWILIACAITTHQKTKLLHSSTL